MFITGYRLTFFTMSESALYQPSAFYFKVIFGTAKSSADNSFQEVSGITSELEIDPIEEGGENRFKHSLPKRIKHGNLVLKRGIADKTSPLIKWCMAVLEGDMSAAIVPETIKIHLLNEKGDPVRGWTVDNAFPVKWNIDGFNSTKSEVAVETIELAYNTLKRDV